MKRSGNLVMLAVEILLDRSTSGSQSLLQKVPKASFAKPAMLVANIVQE